MASRNLTIQLLHTREIFNKTLATEVFKVKSELAPAIMIEVFEIKEPYDNFCSKASHFKRDNIKSTEAALQRCSYIKVF